MTLKERDHFFNLSVTSHMATVAFNKHGAFCEEYVAQAYSSVKKLFRDGPSQNAIDVAQKLGEIRQRHAPWVTADILKNLKPFEDAIFRVGTTSLALGSGADIPDRPREIKEMIDTFSHVIGQPGEDGKINPDIGPDQVVVHLQNILGISELTQLRRTIALRAIQDSGQV